LLELLHLIVVDGQNRSSVAHITARMPLLLPAHWLCYSDRLSSQGCLCYLSPTSHCCVTV